MNLKRPLVLSVLGLVLVLMLGACSNDPVEPVGQVSLQARDTALSMTADALRADRSMATAQSVEMLTGDFSDGISDDRAGLQVELGDRLQLDGQTEAMASIGRRLLDSKTRIATVEEQLIVRMHDARKSDPQPGDLLFRFSETNLDGSTTVISVYQDAPLAVVKVELVTTWPDSNLLLSRADEIVFVDRGVDFVDASDDVWLSYEGSLTFKNGATLFRSIDERTSGGIHDESRVELISRFRPRPNHPRLLEIRCVLVVDVHLLNDESDDRYVSAERHISFQGVAHDGGSPRVVESFVPENPLAEGEEACGGELSRSVYFRSDRRLERWTDVAQWSCDGGGHLRRDVAYADGDNAYVAVTEQADGIVVLDAEDRDGTHTTGSFDESTGRFELNTRYPSGSTIVSREISGSTVSNGWTLDESITYDDAFIEVNHLEASETASGKTLSGNHHGRDEVLTFAFSSNSDDTVFTGHVENNLDQSYEFTIEVYEDGSRSVHFTAVDKEVTVEGTLTIDPEGCGLGTLTVSEDGNTVRIEVSFCDRELVDNGDGYTLHL